MEKTYTYDVQIVWTGNKGEGTKDYKSYDRSHTIKCHNKIEIFGSSDPAFLGDPKKWNPEEMLLASISSCHMLWYLHLCASNKITVHEYTDEASAIMETESNGKGKFTYALLKPRVVIQERDKEKLAKELHILAHDYCFIANSLNFKIELQPEILFPNA